MFLTWQNIEIEQIIDEHVIALVICVTIDGISTRATGSAKRHPTDTFNEVLGTELALGRALQKLSVHFLHDANKRINQQKRHSQ